MIFGYTFPKAEKWSYKNTHMQQRYNYRVTLIKRQVRIIQMSRSNLPYAVLQKRDLLSKLAVH